MKSRMLNKINGARTAEEVQKRLLYAGFVPLGEGDFENLSLMTVFKGKERHSGRDKKTDGIYTKLQSFCCVEGAEDCEFIALSADRKTARKGADGKRRECLYCKMFYRRKTET